MKVLILGGAGVFGSRLARMLLEDGWEVIVAGRSLARAASFTAEFGGTPLALDRGEDPTPHLGGCLAVVDAAGPFQFYGNDGYGFARKVLAAGVNYLDLSDDASFTAGIAELDDLPNRAGPSPFPAYRRFRRCHRRPSPR